MNAIDINTNRALVYDLSEEDLAHRDCSLNEDSDFEVLNQDNWPEGNYTCWWCGSVVALRWQAAHDPFQQHYL